MVAYDDQHNGVKIGSTMGSRCNAQPSVIYFDATTTKEESRPTPSSHTHTQAHTLCNFLFHGILRNDRGEICKKSGEHGCFHAIRTREKQVSLEP